MLSRGTLLAAAAAGVVLIGGLGVLARADGGGIPPGVSVDGVSVGGASESDAEALIRERARRLLDEQTTIESRSVPDFSRRLTRRDLRAQPQVSAALAEASEGRNPLGRVAQRLGLGDTRDVTLRFSFDEARVASLISSVRGRIDEAPQSASIVLAPEAVQVTPSRSGRRLDADLLRAELERFPRRIEAPLREDPPKVADAAAQKARRVAEKLLATPPTVILGTIRESLTEADIREALVFTEKPPSLQVGLTPDVLREKLGPAFSEGEREPLDADFEIVGPKVKVTPSRPGRGVDMERLGRTLVARAGRPQTGARFTQLAPNLTTAEARKLRITERIASFSTPYVCCPGRVTNIQRGAEILDGTIIPAGGRFSLNAALGQRTIERGFVPAGQIVNGRLEDAVGGGVSQLATTIYNAAFFGGLEIIDHTPHQFYISRYPEGREATVSWGGPELIVRNDWPAAVLMKLSAGSAGVAVELYSTSLGRKVETATLSRNPGRAPRVIEKKNPDLPPGTRTVLQTAGAAGFTISYSRQLSVNGKTKRDETFTWRYSAQDSYVEIGPPKKPDPKDDKDGKKGADTEPQDGASGADPPTESATTTPEETSPSDTTAPEPPVANAN